MQKAALFIVLLFLCGCKSLVPGDYKNYFFNEAWKNIHLAKSDEVPIASDSMVILRTNRNFHPENEKFLTDEIDSSGTERTFLIVAKNGKWRVYPIKNIDAGMNLIGKKQNLVVYVEGMGKNFFLAADRALYMSAQYGVSVVMMDYPSTNPLYGMTKNFRSARKNSYASTPAFLNLLKELDSAKKEKKDWTKRNWTLFNHSMGNIMLRRMLKERSDTLLTPGLFDIVVLNAACTDEKDHKKWIEPSKLGSNFIINYNKFDKQLNGAQFLLFKRQLGTKPLRPFSEKAIYIDFNPLVGNRHSTFLDLPFRTPIKPQAKQYFSFILNGKLPDFSKTNLFTPSRKGIGYSIE